MTPCSLTSSRCIDAGRRPLMRTTNAIMTATYWGVGLRIVEEEQHAEARAEYGEELLPKLSADLQAWFGRGYGRAKPVPMKAFYLAHREILQTSSGHSGVRRGPRESLDTVEPSYAATSPK